MKKFLLILIILACAVFIYLKVQIMGDPSSNFNQTTRFSLGAHPVLRTLLGLHSAGDARTEYLSGSGPITIVWYEPISDQIDNQVIQQLADVVGKVTGRQVVVQNGSGIDSGTLNIQSYSSLKLQEFNQGSGAKLLVIFADDYTPRAADELSTTYGESGMVLSITAHQKFLQNYQQDLDNYLVASVLHEFGHQIGLEHDTDSYCIMDAHAGINGQPVEAYGRTEPQNFCPAEILQINKLKSEY